MDLRTGAEATEESLKALAPDAIILSTGFTPLVLPIPGLADCGYVTAQDMLEGKAPMGRRVLVVGGGMVGCEAAKAPGNAVLATGDALNAALQI